MTISNRAIITALIRRASHLDREPSYSAYRRQLIRDTVVGIAVIGIIAACFVWGQP